MTRKNNDVDEMQAEAEAFIHNVEEKAEQVEQEAEAYTKAAAQYIKKNPLKSATIAALAGILIGKLFG